MAGKHAHMHTHTKKKKIVLNSCLYDSGVPFSARSGEKSRNKKDLATGPSSYLECDAAS
jgi:hypothetical protein